MKNKGKIHVITKYFLPVVAGIEVNILETYSVLAKEGWDVTIHTSKDTYLQKDHLPDTDEIRGLKIIRYPFRWFGFSPKINWNEKTLIALHNFDIFPHIQIMLKTLLLKILGKKSYKLFLTPHGGFNPEWSIFNSLSAFVKRTYTYSLGTWLINASVDGVRAVSDWENAEMKKKGIKRNLVTTIANGLEDDAFLKDDEGVSKDIKNKVKKYGKYIFEDARIYSIKNQETIIKSLPLIPKDINFVNIGMVGDEKYKEGLLKLAKDLGVEKRVIFPGVIRGADKYYLNRNAIAFVHMAKWESFCNVVHQAISQGLVCLVADNTALPYLVKDGVNGYLINTYDHRQLAQKINYILDPINKKNIDKIKRYNYKHGRENSWTNVAQKMSLRYLEIMNKK